MDPTVQTAITLTVYLGSLYGVCKIVDWVFNQDDVIKKTSKEKLGAWLQNLKFENKAESWPDGFIALFDRWFGEKHWSWKCFFRSSLTLINVNYNSCVTTIKIPGFHS